MKIYFAASIRGGRDHVWLYDQIIAMLKEYGEVLTEHIGDKQLTSLGEDGPTDQFIYDRDIAWVRLADVVVAEVTMPSLGVGYEIAKAEEWGKPVLCLYRPTPGKKLSAMIQGSPLVVNASYADIGSARREIDGFFRSLPSTIR